MFSLKAWLTEHFDPDTAKKVLIGITGDADNLKVHEEIGTNIAQMYDHEIAVFTAIFH